MEETTVSATSAPTPAMEPANVFSFGPEPTEAVDAPAGTEEQAAQPQTVEAEQPAEGVDNPQLEGKKQKDVGAAFAAEKKRLEKKFRTEYEQRMRTDPTYKAGEMLIADIMDREGISHDEAAKIAADRLMDAVAEREGVGKGIVRRLYGQEHKAAEAQEPQEEGGLFGGQTLDGAVRELSEMSLPDGFDLDAATKDSGFAALLTEMPVSAAVRVYHAERKAASAPQDVAEKLLARQKVPQSERPQQSASPRISFSSMSDDEFLAYRAHIRT